MDERFFKQALETLEQNDCKPGDVISVKENSMEHKGIEIALANVKSRVEYINYDEKKKQATYVRYPQRSELNAEINESLIVEYYSRV